MIGRKLVILTASIAIICGCTTEAAPQADKNLTSSNSVDKVIDSPPKCTPGDWRKWCDGNTNEWGQCMGAWRCQRCNDDGKWVGEVC